MRLWRFLTWPHIDGVSGQEIGRLTSVTRDPRWPRRLFRPQRGACPYCGAHETRFCFAGCISVDLWDWN